MRFAIDHQPLPHRLLDVDLGCGNLRIAPEQEAGKLRCEVLHRLGGRFLCARVDRVLHGVGRQHQRVVGLGVARAEIALD